MENKSESRKLESNLNNNLLSEINKFYPLYRKESQESVESFEMIPSNNSISSYLRGSSYKNLKPSSVSQLEIVNGKKSLAKKFEGECSICKKNLTFSKYLCVVCEDLSLCNICEQNHGHPVIKLKNSKNSSLREITRFIKHHQLPPKKVKLFRSIFESKIKMRISALSQNFAMRPNQKLMVPIIIENLSNYKTDENNIIFIHSKNNKNIYVKDTQIVSNFKEKEQKEIELEIQSSNECNVYNFTVEVYTNCPPKKIKEVNSLKFTVEVNEDKEEDEYNIFFKDSPKILVLEKSQKEKIMKIIEEKISTSHPYIIMSLLNMNHWDLEKTILEMTTENEQSKLTK